MHAAGGRASCFQSPKSRCSDATSLRDQGACAMKVVLFCGGEGLRMREASETVPKPMVPIGSHPILWHVMKYYAHFGHTEFVLCLGHKAEVVKNYFLHYDEALSNDFVLSREGKR